MDFYEKMALVCKQIPPGRVATYGQIALLCQEPAHARQVGYGLNRRMKEEVPAHRVVNHRGRLSGAMAFEMPDLQRLLLEEEGVEVSADQRVDLNKYGWKHTLEDAVRFSRLFEEEPGKQKEGG